MWPGKPKGFGGEMTYIFFPRVVVLKMNSKVESLGISKPPPPQHHHQPGTLSYTERGQTVEGSHFVAGNGVHRWDSAAIAGISLIVCSFKLIATSKG